MKLFNKQRFRFLEGKDFKKYLKYAFGEIVLVVIGILIAVSINNWNQRKQLDSANVELRENIIKQLDKDIASISAFQQNLDTLQKNYLNYLKANDSINPIPGDVLGSLLFEVNTMDLDSHVMTMIDNATLNQSKASEELLNLNSTYKIYKEELAAIERLIFTGITENLKEIERSQDWYIEFVTNLVCKNDCIHYFYNDKHHKARIASLRFLYINGYGQTIANLKEDLIGYRGDLDAIAD
ncbi:MAG: DUF6090 family protein [Bacteroidota bacterium]